MNKRLYLFCIIILEWLTCTAQVPTMDCKIVNYTQTSFYNIQFDIEATRTGSNTFELANQQYGININPQIINGGTLTLTIDGSNTGLSNTSQIPTSIVFNSTSNQIRIAAPSIVPAGTGSIISTVGTIMFTVKIANTTPFGRFNPNLSFYTGISSATTTKSFLSAWVGTSLSILSNTFIQPVVPNISIPTITNISITGGSGMSCSAGEGDRIIIDGYDFGNTYNSSSQVTYLVKMKDANDGGQSFMTLDKEDVIPTDWTDTHIEFNLSAMSSFGGGSFKQGSGPIVIVNNYGLGSLPSIQSLDIQESFTQVYNITPGVKGRVYLNRNNCINGILYRVSPDIASNSTILGSVERALAEWSIKTGIEMKIEKSGGVPVTSINGNNANDNINTIFQNAYSITTPAGFVMQTYFASANCSAKAYRKDTDIEILTDNSWASGTTQIQWHYLPKGNLPSGKTDFYAAILHEIGHCLGLNHVIDPFNYSLELMYFQGGIGPTNEADRTTLSSAGANSLSAGIVQSTQGKNHIWTCANLYPLFTIPYITNPPGTSQPIELQLCTGSTLQLNSSSASGNIWSTGANTNFITVSSTGSYAVSNTINSCASTSAPVLVTQNTLTGIIGPSNQTTCANGSVSFSCTHPNSVSYQWQQKHAGSSAFVNIVNNSNFSGSQSATLQVSAITSAFNNRQYRCLVSSATACAASSAATLTVTSTSFSRLPSQYNNVANYTLTQGTPTPGSYSGTSITGGNIFHPLTAGTGTHTLTYTPNCGSGSVNQPIIVVPSSSPTTTTNEVPSLICIIANANVPITVYCTFLGSYNSGNTFQVQLSNSSGSFVSATTIGTTTNASSSSVACTIPGTTSAGSGYQIRINATNPNGTLNIYNTKPVVVEKAVSGSCNQQFFRLSETEDFFSILPNPSSDLITVSFENNLTGLITITDVQGKNIFSGRVDNANKFDFDISDFSVGVYFIKVNGERISGSKKFIKN